MYEALWVVNLGNAFFILSLDVGTANCGVALLQDQSVPASSQVPIVSYQGPVTKLLFLGHTQSLNDMSHSGQFSFFLMPAHLPHHTAAHLRASFFSVHTLDIQTWMHSHELDSQLSCLFERFAR